MYLDILHVLTHILFTLQRNTLYSTTEMDVYAKHQSIQCMLVFSLNNMDFIIVMHIPTSNCVHN